MRRSHVRGVVALEEEALRVEEGAVAAPADEVALDNAESVETELLEVAEVEAEGGEEAAQVDEAAEVVEALESMADALKISAANGGMDRYSAAVVNIATEHLYARVGITGKKMPALESFGGVATRVGATQLAMEEIVETAKKIWAAIVAAFERAIQWAKDFFTKVFNSWEKLDARAKELAAKADKAKGTGKVTTGGVIKGLEIAGAAPALDTGLKTFEDFVTEVFSATNKKAKKVADDVAIVESLNGKDMDGNDVNIDGYGEWFTGLTAAEGFPEAKEGLGTYRSAEMFGGNALIAILPKERIEGDNAVKALGGVSFRVGAYDPAAKETTVKELSALNAGDVKKVTDAVQAVAKSGIAYKSAAKTAEDQKKKMVAAAKKFSSEKDPNKNAKALVMGLVKLIDQPAASAAAYSLRTAKTLLDYVEESLKEPKAEKAAEPAKA